MALWFPLASAWVLGRPGLASFALGGAAILAFLVHEPLLVVLGRRGARRAREEGAIARRRLIWLSLAFVAAAAVGWSAATPLARLLSLVPAGFGALSMVAAVRGRERSLVGELHVGLSLSSIALPVAVAAGVSAFDAAMLASVWTVIFGVGTLAARGVALQKKDRGRGRRLSLVLSLIVALVAVSLAVFHLVPAWVPLAPVPTVLVALLVSLRPPPPKRMATIGLGLVGASAVTFAILLVTAGVV